MAPHPAHDMPPPPRALRILATVFGVCAILALGGVLLRLVAASRLDWRLEPLDVALLAIDAVVCSVNALGFVAIRRAWARAAVAADRA